MYRAIAIPRRAPGRGFVRARTRLASTTPAPSTAGAATSSASASSAPKKAKNVVQKLIFYSVTATGTFYIGSTFVSYQNQQYRDLFTKYVPLGDVLVEYGEQHRWDEITVQQVVVATVDTATAVYDFVQRQLVHVTQNTETKAKDPAPSDKDAALERRKAPSDETKTRVKSTAAVLKTNVHKAKEELSPDAAAKATALARYKAAQLADEVDELIKKAEAALAKPIESTLEPTPTPESSTSLAAVPARDVEVVVLSEKPQEANVYVDPLPIGFEPPPGFSRPKPAPKPKAGVLPLVAPAVSDLAISEPVISHLAGTIDDLASYLKANPTAAEKATGILDTARNDLTELAARFDKIKEDEKHELEAKLDEQAREYSTKLLELELESQDKLTLQREDYENYVAEEKMKLVQAYRERLDNELKAQTDMLNERLKEAIIAQGVELQRRWIREVKVKVEEERGGRLARLDELATGLKRLERVALDNSSYLDENIRIHGMWTALRALQTAIDAPERKPFREELRILRHIAVAKDDEVVSAALASLEQSDTPDVGVEPLADLATWFTTSVAPRVASVALVPDENAGVLSYLASHLLSSFRFQRHGLAPGSDVLSVLSRAEFYMNEKDLDSAARALNQLTGPAKELLHDWLEAARRRLEAQQALEVSFPGSNLGTFR
ncbi:mitochondrial inner membrane protein Mitofilin [Boletus reticuloceps]|uniref:MICOS complex subunit MIC60 n=1 Tax=Boletus reticuloceps TaxID=495285 RepID=A0A8I2YG18_9AGAM|nr:mitochondrial inner membrane protein Mitofilin [Boletus reticuloceps]